MLKKIRIVFLYRGLCFWLNNHSFYKECLWDGNFDIWVVPEANYIEPEILSMLKKDRVKIISKKMSAYDIVNNAIKQKLGKITK